ncbi:MAG: Rrf2 family transcriptional regulator [Rhodanobacter sp.]
MRHDSRLSRVLHALIHMDGHDGRATSETIGRMLGTNAVVVRRTMAGLRDAGYVRSDKGPGGGWTLVRPLSGITLFDVYSALGSPPVFALGLAEDQPQCLVEQAVNATVAGALHEAESALMTGLKAVTLADIAQDFGRRLKRSGAHRSAA